MVTRGRRPLGLLGFAALALTGALATACGGSAGTPARSALRTSSPPASSSPSSPAPTSSSPPPATTSQPPPATTGPGGTAAVTRCRPGQLDLGLGRAHPAAGTVYQALRFTNTGDEACTMHGFPKVTFVTGDQGKQVGAPAKHQGQHAPTVTLQPGETASAILGTAQWHNYPQSRCEPTHVRGLRVYPPDDSAAMFVPRAGKACSTSVSQLTVKPVQPASGGQ